MHRVIEGTFLRCVGVGFISCFFMLLLHVAYIREECSACFIYMQRKAYHVNKGGRIIDRHHIIFFFAAPAAQFFPGMVRGCGVRLLHAATCRQACRSCFIIIFLHYYVFIVPCLSTPGLSARAFISLYYHSSPQCAQCYHTTTVGRGTTVSYYYSYCCCNPCCEYFDSKKSSLIMRLLTMPCKLLLPVV